MDRSYTDSQGRCGLRWIKSEHPKDEPKNFHIGFALPSTISGFGKCAE